MKSLSEEELQIICSRISRGERDTVARMITLLESQKADDADTAQHILHHLLPTSKNTLRVGLGGPPGVGKSSLIEMLGSNWLDAGHRVAVLATDPTSEISGGSLLADKTRMHRLATDPNAYVRPLPQRQAVGGISAATADAIKVCESAGYDRIIIESLGSGQAEFRIANCVDIFTLLMSPGEGDDLQAIKRGVLEHADVLVITKHDGKSTQLAEKTQHLFSNMFSATGRKLSVFLTTTTQAKTLKPFIEYLENYLREDNVSQRIQKREQQKQQLFSFWLERFFYECIHEVTSFYSQNNMSEISPYAAARSTIAQLKTQLLNKEVNVQGLERYP
ncbi:MAG: hypothetical protein V4629_10080 [Pseudomonadota bacterium]